MNEWLSYQEWGGREREKKSWFYEYRSFFEFADGSREWAFLGRGQNATIAQCSGARCAAGLFFMRYDWQVTPYLCHWLGKGALQLGLSWPSAAGLS